MPDDHSDKAALILLAQPTERRVMHRILAATGADVDQATSLAAAESRPYRLVVVDLEGGQADGEVFDALGRLAERRPAPAIVLLTDRREQSGLAEIIARSAFNSLVVKSAAFKKRELIVTVQKWLRNDIFGLEKYLPWGVQVHSQEVTSSAQKGPLLEELNAFLERLGCQSRMVGLACGVADEFLMNAIYNAPVDESGVQKYAAWPRSRQVDLLPREEVSFRFACDGHILALSVSDNFGGLQRSTLIRYLSKGLRKGTDQIDDKPGGAGLGLYYIFESLNSFIVNVAKGKRTEMIGLIDLCGSYREFSKRTRSLHLFYQE